MHLHLFGRGEKFLSNLRKLLTLACFGNQIAKMSEIRYCALALAQMTKKLLSSDIQRKTVPQ